MARVAGGGSSNWNWAAGRGRKQRRSSKGNIQHRTGGARCCHLHKRKRAVRKQHSWGGKDIKKPVNESELKKCSSGLGCPGVLGSAALALSH